MKTTALFLLCLLGLISTLKAGTWTVQPWTGDASTGIVNGETVWAYHFGSGTTATVNAVSVPGLAGPPPVSVAGQVEVSGLQFVLGSDINNLTSLTGTGSAVLGGSFFYGGFPARVTVKAASMVPGRRYAVSLLSVGWDDAPGLRLIKFVSGSDELPADQAMYGENNGLRAIYEFVAGSGDQVIDVEMVNGTNRTFHFYAVALSQVSRTVTTLADTGPGSLRQTIADAPAGVLIRFDPTLAGQSPQVTGGEIILDKDLIIDGSALEGAAVQGAGTNRLFYIPVTRTVIFRNLTLAGGGGAGAANTGRGGAVLNAGSFTALDCIFRDNRASLGGGVASGYSTQNTFLTLQRCLFTGNASTTGFGGALTNLCINGTTSTALIEDSTFTGNSASGGGGAIYNAGNTGTSSMTIRQSTITANSITNDTNGGGGVINYAGLAGCTANLTLTHCTIVKNTSGMIGGGVSQAAVTGGTATITLTSNIIAENTASVGPDVRLDQGTRTSLGTNLIGDATGSEVTWLGSDLTGTAAVPLEARLASLGYYGGPTPTCPPLLGSPALDAAPTPAFTNDQRGLPRVVDADGAGGAQADIGAVESKLIQVDVAEDELETPAGENDVSLHEALRDAPAGAIITFAPGLSGQTLTLNSGGPGEVQLTQDVTVDASSLPEGFGITLGTGNHRLLNVYAGVSATLRNLRFIGGAGTVSASGTAIQTAGRLSLNRCSFTGFKTSNSAGALQMTGGTLDVSDSTFSGNTAAGNGGAILIYGGRASFTQCTIHGNTGSVIGGGLAFLSGSAALVHCTVTGNTIPNGAGGGIYMGGSSLSLHNSIVAGNTSSAAAFEIENYLGTLTRTGVNIIGREEGASTAFPAGLPNANGDYVGTATAPLDPLLGALANNGGPTQTCLPLPASPATDHATGTVPALDQRGFSRPRDGNGDNSFIADIGAAENGPEALFQVNTLADELDTPPGTSFSLREALREAFPGRAITFAPALSGKTLTLDAAKGEISISKSVIVDASGLPLGLTLDAGTGTNRHFYVNAAGAIELRHLTLTGGGGTGTANSGFGGSILSFGSMNLVDCTFRSNQSDIRGGAVAAALTKVQLTRCTFHDNLSSTDDGGALYFQNAPAVLDHCTLTRNHAQGGDGGALFSQSGTDLTLTHCTIAGNTSNNANGGIAIVGEVEDKLTLNSTILAGNQGQDLRIFNVAPTPTSGGGNVMGLDLIFANFNATGDVRNVTAVQLGLAELGRYGGLTDTMPPLPGSPAMDAASLSTATTDQRGFARTVDGNFDSTATSDSGAAESFVVRATTTNDQNDTPAGSLISLREAVRDAPEGAVITSSLSSSHSITLGEIIPTRSFILANQSLTSRLIIKSPNVRNFYLPPGIRGHFSRVNLEGGRGVGAVHSGRGGAVLNQGFLSMSDCTVQFCTANDGAGIANGLAATPSRLLLRRCRISSNTASGNGGALFNNSREGGTATVEMENCIIDRNTATRSGGALANVGGNGSASLTAEHCTIMENKAQSTGGGLFTSMAGASSRLTSCLIAENTAKVGGPDVQTSGGSLTSSGTNLIGITDGSGIVWQENDSIGTAAAPFAARVTSELDTYIPMPDSPAVDAAAVTTRTFLDRSGNPRSLDGDLSGTAQPDIGAYETAAIRVTTAVDELDTPSGANISLREAIRDAGASPVNTILRLDPALSGQTLTLDAGLGQLVTGKSVFLDASDLAEGFTIDGGTGTNRVIHHTGGTLHLRGVKLTGGSVSGDGGAILNESTLMLENCTLADNSATGLGGAIHSTSQLLVKNCTFTRNSATSHGGALSSSGFSVALEGSAFLDNESAGSGGGIYISAGGTITNRMVQCTVSGNRSAQRGGGVWLGTCQMSVIHCTITRNEAATERGGGLVMAMGTSLQTLQNTVIAENRAPTRPEVSVDSWNSFWPLSAGGNLIGQNTGATTFFPAGLPNTSGDYVGSETAPLKALLAPHGTYGGTTATCPPMLGSPALEKAVPVTTLNLLSSAAVPGSLSTDQRGFTRSEDGDFSGSALPDIGAAESVIVRVDTAADELNTPAGVNGFFSLREVLRDAPEGAVIGFAPALSDARLSLNSQLVPERSVVISSAGLAQRVILTAEYTDRIFQVNPGLSFGLSDINLHQSALETDSGGAIYNEGSTSLANCELNINNGTLGGGAIASIGAVSNPRNVSLRLFRCDLLNNGALGGGGAVICRNYNSSTVHQATFEDCLFQNNYSRDTPGGAVTNQAAVGQSLMTLRRCTLRLNEADDGVGGGLCNWASSPQGKAVALLEACTLTENWADEGGGVASLATSGGTATTTLRQCTLAYNKATVRGDDVINKTSDSGSTSTLSLIQCTVIGNPSSPSAGGVVGFAMNPGNTNTTILDRSIIARHNAHDVRVLPDPGSPASTTITSLGTNLIGKTDGTGVTWQPGDLTGTNATPLDPMLIGPGEYGGPIQTMPPLPGSPVRDPASGATSATGQVDQRGGARLVGAKVDIGAVEAGAADAPGTIAFGGPVVRVNEGANPAMIPVYRTAGTIGTVTVNYQTFIAGSAAGFAAANDFSMTSGTVTFLTGQTVANIPIIIASDPTVKEPHESFNLILSNPGGGGVLGTQNSTVVRILDFVDASAPTLTLATPAANAIFTAAQGPQIAVAGSAKDDKGVQAVQVQFNGGTFVDAALLPTVPGTNPTFSLGVTAVPGINNLVVRVVDEKGRISALTKRSFTYKVPSTLTVNLIGPANSGTVSAGFTPSSTRDVGMTYKITATAKPGFIFNGWGGSPGPVVGIPNGLIPTTISFVMKPGLTLIASFSSLAGVSTYAGTYQGLLTPFYDSIVSDNTTVGFTSTSVTSTGAVTGKVLIDGSSLPFTGQILGGSVVFNPARGYALDFVRKGKATIKLSVSVSGGSNSSATVYLEDNRLGYSNPFSYTNQAYRSPYSSKSKVPTSLVTGTSQRYNLIFPSVPYQAVSSYPPGTGIGSLILGSDGSAKMAGTLADNTTFTASTTLSSQHTVPLFASLYTNQGHIAGNINVVGPTGPGYDAYGVNFYWARPAQPKAQWYPLGWPKSFFTDLVGAKYLLPAATANQSLIPNLGPVDATNTLGNATLTFMDGLLTTTQTFPVNITTKNAVTPLPLKTKNFTLKLTPATGEISGTFLHTDTKKPAFKATTIQKPGDYQGTYGFFMSVPPNTTSTNGQGGSVMLLPGGLAAP